MEQTNSAKSFCKEYNAILQSKYTMTNVPAYPERKGSLLLRSTSMKYHPRVFTSPWHANRESYPRDYDVETAPEFNVFRSTYNRLDDLGYSMPDPTTREFLEQGIQKITSLREYDRREAVNMFSMAHTGIERAALDCGTLAHAQEAVAQPEMISTTHDHYRLPKDTPLLPVKCIPLNDAPVMYRKCRTGLEKHSNSQLPTDPGKFMDDAIEENPFLQMKRAEQPWPINPVTGSPLKCPPAPPEGTCARFCPENKIPLAKCDRC